MQTVNGKTQRRLLSGSMVENWLWYDSVHSTWVTLDKYIFNIRLVYLLDGTQRIKEEKERKKIKIVITKDYVGQQWSALQPRFDFRSGNQPQPLESCIS